MLAIRRDKEIHREEGAVQRPAVQAVAAHRGPG